MYHWLSPSGSKFRANTTDKIVPENDDTPARAPAPPPAAPLNLKDVLEAASKGLLAAAGLCYVLGLVVSNIHFGRYGYYSLSLLQINYVFAGFWSLLPIIVAAFAVNFLYMYLTGAGWEGERPQRKFSLKEVAAGILGILILVTMLSAAVHLIGESIGFRISWGWLAVSLVGILPASAFVAFALSIVAPWAGKRNVNRSLLLLMNFAIALTFYLGFFSLTVYRDIPAGMGGGRPARVRFVVDAAEKPFFLSSGIAFNERDGNSRAVELLLNTEEGYVVRPDGAADTVIIPRERVKALLIGQGGATPTPTPTAEPTTTPTPEPTPTNAPTDAPTNAP